MRLGVIADPHLSLDRVEDAAWHNPYRLADAHTRFVAALAHPLIAPADAVVVLGDLAHFGDERSMRFVVDAVTTCGKPAVLLSGNHDVLEPGVRLSGFVAPPAPVELFRDSGFAVEVHQVTELARTGAQPFDVTSSMLVDPVDERTPLLVLAHFPLLGGLERRAHDAGLLYSGHLEQLAPPPPTAMRPGRPTVVLSGHLHLRGVTIDGDALNVSFAALVEPPYEVAAVDISATEGLAVAYTCASVREPDADTLPVLDGPEGTLTWSSERGWTD